VVFSSLLFLFRFLPVAFIIYYAVPWKLKNLSLLLLSLFFYSWGEPRYFPVMLATILVNYLAALGIEKFAERKGLRRACFLIAVFFSLGMLIFFKYTNFFIENLNGLLNLSIGTLELTLPLGISFYTFQTMSYTIDVYRGKVKAEHNIIDLGAFVVLFPQLIAGPIVLYTDINKELKSRKIRLAQIEEGVKIFILGLGKKVLIANNIGALWTEVETLGFANVSTPLAWLGILAFALQIFFDFSGYSTMAIGLGKMLGFEFPENFNYPYIARSITDFWRRWHMTLSSWFREYVYIPLGGNRKGKARMYFNLFVVWACTGFWHGANWNFIFWGLFFFVFLAIEKAGFSNFLDKHRIFSHVYVLFLLLISWSLFAITDLGQLGTFFTKLFSFSGGMDWLYYLRNYAVTIVIACFLSTPLIAKVFSKVDVNWIKNAIYLLIFLLSVAYLVDATYNPFLYFRF
jgi:alginate O-acetyltransferase complex protein AlgI